jgi:hypothetical protein
MKNSPCNVCLVKPICKYYCDVWFHWVYVKSILPLDTDIQINKFLELVGDYGPIKNYYQNEYRTLKLIKFEKTIDSNRLRVCLFVD